MLPACSQEYLQREFVTNNTHYLHHNMLGQGSKASLNMNTKTTNGFPLLEILKKNQFWPKAQYHVKDFDNNLEHNLIVESSVYNLVTWDRCWAASYLTLYKYYDTLGLKSQDKCLYLYKLL